MTSGNLLALLNAWTLLDLLGIGLLALGIGLPPGWKARSVRGVERPAFEIAKDGADPIVRIHGTGQAAWFYRPVKEPLAQDHRLHWSWRVLQAPEGAAFNDRARDDSPIRVYVAFGKLGGLFGGSGRVIFYSFSGNDSTGYSAPSHVNTRIHVIGVDGPAAIGSWREHEVDPIADYRRIWGREPEPITAIGLMQDTDQTRQAAVAEVRRLEWAAALPPR